MTGAYTFSIPSTAALADLSAATFCGAPAPAIAAGSNRDVVDMTNAIEETRARKRCKQTHDTSVTAGELAASIIRQTAVASEFVADTYNNNHGDGLAGAPAWAAPLIANVATLTANQATMSANVATLMANQATMDARLRAERAQRRNQRNHRTDGSHPLTQLVKCAADVGPPLPGRVAQSPAAAAVGTVYPTGGLVAMAPTTSNDLNKMTLDRISLLAEWANDDFGIIAGDTVAIQRNKLLQHYLYD